LTNKYAIDRERVDSQVVIWALAVVTYRPAITSMLYVQLLRRDYIRELMDAGIRNVYCADAIKLGLLGHSLVTPGVATLLSNVIRTYTQRAANYSLSYDWRDEYFTGCCHGVRSAPLRSFAGKTYLTAACENFSSSHAVLFGVETSASESGFDQSLPGANRITKIISSWNDTIGVDDIGFFISSSILDSDKLLSRDNYARDDAEQSTFHSESLLTDETHGNACTSGALPCGHLHECQCSIDALRNHYIVVVW